MSGSATLLSGQPDLDFPLFVGDVVHQQILSQIIGTGEEYPSFVDTCHLRNEATTEQAAALKHERVYHDALERTVPHFS